MVPLTLANELPSPTGGTGGLASKVKTWGYTPPVALGILINPCIPYLLSTLGLLSTLP